MSNRKLDYTGDGVNKQINGDPTSGMKTMAARLLSDNIIVLKQILSAHIKIIKIILSGVVSKIVHFVRKRTIDQ